MPKSIAELINIADSRFQDSLVAQAIAAGKLPTDYRVPEIYRHNTPERLAAMLSAAKREGHFAPFPFGTELTEDEQALGHALKQIKSVSESPFGKLKLIWMAGHVRRGSRGTSIHARAHVFELSTRRLLSRDSIGALLTAVLPIQTNQL